MCGIIRLYYFLSNQLLFILCLIKTSGLVRNFHVFTDENRRFLAPNKQEDVRVISRFCF